MNDRKADRFAAVDAEEVKNLAADIAASANLGELEDKRVRYLGRKSKLKLALREVRDRESGMTLNAQRVWPVPYQWRRVLTLSLVAVGLLVIGKAVDAPLPLAIALCLVYPIVLLPFRFYLPAELRRLRPS